MESLIEARHQLPEWATFREFSNATGAGVSGRIDVAAFNVWPSRKGHRVAYEVKRERSDFLRELAQPEKRAWVEELFHETYFVATKGVCEPHEIPEGWGLLIVVGEAGDKLRRKVVPKYRDVLDPPYDFVMSLLRRSAADLSTELSRTYRFEGEEITSKAIEEKIQIELRSQHERLMKSQEQVEQIRSKLTMDQSRLKAPLDTLKRLALKLSGWQSRHADEEEITPETVRSWWKEMKIQAAESVRVELADARNRLDALVQSFDEENESRRTGT